MPVSVNTLKARLDACSSVFDLIETDKKHIFDLLKCLDRNEGRLTVSDLKRDYLGCSRVSLRISNSYLIAYLYWLTKNNYLANERKKRLTDKGEEAILELHEYLSPQESELRFFWNFSPQTENKVTLEGVTEISLKSAVFSNKFIRDRILELSSCLSYLRMPVELRIQASPTDPDFVAILRFFWDFYLRTVTEWKVGLNPFGAIFLDLHFVDDESQQRYFDFWKKHLEEYTLYKDQKTGEFFDDGKRIPEMTVQLFPLVPQKLEDLLPMFLQKSSVRSWVESILEKDADWFMPHPIWVELGFKQRRDDITPDSVKHVTPPVFHEIETPQLPSQYSEFDSILRYLVVRGREEGVKALCLWLISADWKNVEFYKTWAIMRREHSSKIESDSKLSHVAKVLDQALIEYIKANNFPNVNLKIAISDYLQSKNPEIVIGNIKKGKYRLDTSQ